MFALVKQAFIVWVIYSIISSLCNAAVMSNENEINLIVNRVTNQMIEGEKNEKGKEFIDLKKSNKNFDKDFEEKMRSDDIQQRLKSFVILMLIDLSPEDRVKIRSDVNFVPENLKVKIVEITIDALVYASNKKN